MKKIFAALLLSLGLPSHSLSPNEMLVIVGAVKYYNEQCAGINPSGSRLMHKGLKRFKMDRTPLYILEQQALAQSGYQTAVEFGCEGTRNEAYRAGFGRYIN